MQTLEQLIAQAPVFEGMQPAHLQVISGCARNEHVEAGTLVLREGEPADRFFLVRRGMVTLELQAPGRGALAVETLHEGDVVGWAWLFPPHRWPLDGRATEPCELIAFDGACLRGKCELDHELGYELMRRFAAALVDDLLATRLQLLDIYGHAPAPA